MYNSIHEPFMSIIRIHTYVYVCVSIYSPSPIRYGQHIHAYICVCMFVSLNCLYVLYVLFSSVNSDSCKQHQYDIHLFGCEFYVSFFIRYTIHFATEIFL